MSNKDKSTARPWKVQGTYLTGIYGEDGTPLAYTTHSYGVGAKDPNARANSVFIVKAVNQHDVLVDLVRDIDQETTHTSSGCVRATSSLPEACVCGYTSRHNRVQAILEEVNA